MEIDNTDLSKQELKVFKHVEILQMLQVPLYHNQVTGKWYLAQRYWRAIKTELQEAIKRAACLDRIEQKG